MKLVLCPWQIPVPLVVQVCRARDVSRPKAAEGGEHTAMGRLLKLTLTDGITVYQAIENSPCTNIRSGLNCG